MIPHDNARDELGQASNLVIYDLTVEDSGTYHCEVLNAAVEEPKVSNSASITIKPEAETKGAYSPREVVGNYKVRISIIRYNMSFRKSLISIHYLAF